MFVASQVLKEVKSKVCLLVVHILLLVKRTLHLQSSKEWTTRPLPVAREKELQGFARRESLQEMLCL
jgi:hypothetical protein